MAIAQAVATDARGWLAPWLLLGVGLVVVPGMGQSLGWIITAAVAASCWSVCAVMYDIHCLRRDGFSPGFFKRGLRVVDPSKDQLSHLARHPKSLRKLLHGEYEIIHIRSK